MKTRILFFTGVSILSTAFVASANVQPSPSSVLVCRGHQCAVAEYSMTREFLFNKFQELFNKNRNRQVLLCEADPNLRFCYNQALEIDVASGMVPTKVTLPSMTVVDDKLSKDLNLDLILDYNVRAGKIKPKCQSARSHLSVPFVDKIQLNVPEFFCDMSASGNTVINMNYHIDYVDFDYGILGAYYTIGFGGVFRGGKNGYMLMRFTEKMPKTDVNDLMVSEPQPKKQVNSVLPTRSSSMKEEVFLNGEKMFEYQTKESDSVLVPVVVEVPKKDLKLNNVSDLSVAEESISFDATKTPIVFDQVVVNTKQGNIIETKEVRREEKPSYHGILTPAETNDGIEASHDNASQGSKFWNGILSIIYLGN